MITKLKELLNESSRELRKYYNLVKNVNLLEEKYSSYSDDE